MTVVRTPAGTLALTQALAAATDAAFVVIDAWNNGGSCNWPRAFPSLDQDQTEALGDPFAIRYDTVAEAQAAFTTICHDIVEEGCNGLAGGIIHYVASDCGEVGTCSFDSSSDTSRPVFTDGALGHELILERI